MPTLDWIGKRAVVNHHREVPFHLLEIDPELSTGDPESGNLIVQGDNLLALKALLPYYAGQVKCIYIDPPYNTGNEGWVYNDAVNSPEIREWLGRVVGDESADLSRHDKWLCMMYPRLQLLKAFLRDDGVIFVSIDDNELSNLLAIMREIFGSQNFIATLVWEKGKKGDAKLISVNHEYIVAFARNKGNLTRLNVKWRRRKPGVDEVLGRYAAIRAEHGGDHELIRAEMMRWFRSLPAGSTAKAHKHYNWSDVRGLYFPADFSGPDDGRANRPRYDIIHPVTGEPCRKPSTGWRWEEARTAAAIADSPPRIHFGADHTTIPCRKSYLFEVDSEPFPSVFYKDGRAATLQVEQILGRGAFEFPKDADVLTDLIGLVTRSDDIILDSFAGSGSTAHAVVNLNNRDGGHRNFLLIEIDSEIARTKTVPRMRTVAGSNPDTVANNSFIAYRLGMPMFDENGAICETVNFDILARHVFLSETGTSAPEPSAFDRPRIGSSADAAIYVVYSHGLERRGEDSPDILTSAVLASLPPHDGPKIIYAEGCRLSAERLRRENIIFKQIPYDLRTS